MDSIKKSAFTKIFVHKNLSMANKFHVDWPSFTMKILCLKISSIFWNFAFVTSSQKQVKFRYPEKVFNYMKNFHQKSNKTWLLHKIQDLVQKNVTLYSVQFEI